MAALITGIEPIFDFDNPNYFVVKMSFQGTGVNGTYTLTGNSGSQGTVNWTGNIVDTDYDAVLGGYKVTPIEFTPVFRVFSATGVDTGSGTFEADFPASNPYKVSWQYNAGGFVATGATVPQGAAITIGPCVGSKAQVYVYSEPKSPDHFDQVITGQMTLTDTTNSIPYGTGTVVVVEAGAPTYGSVWDLGLQNTGTTNFMVQGSGGVGDTFTLPAVIACITSTCPLVTAGALLPNGASGVAYTHTMTIDGDAPIVLSSIVKPAWMTISITGNTVTFSGTPAVGDVATGISIGFTATNTCGDISFTDTIDVISSCAPPVVSINQGTIVICTGDADLYTSTVFSGTAPFTYQWFKNNVAISGETTPNLIVTTGGVYRLEVTNACGTGVTTSSTVIENIPVSITSGETLPDALVGSAYSASVVYAGTAPLVISNIVKPVWATVTLTGNTVSITGTPAAGDVTASTSFSWDITNTCNVLPFSDTIAVTNTPICVALSGGTINGVSSSNSGATETYNVTGLSGDTPYTYSWTIANGTILSGQGTPSITVLWD